MYVDATGLLSICIGIMRWGVQWKLSIDYMWAENELVVSNIMYRITLLMFVYFYPIIYDFLCASFLRIDQCAKKYWSLKFDKDKRKL